MAGDKKTGNRVAETHSEVAQLAKRHRLSKEVVKYLIAKHGTSRAVLEKALENQSKR